MKSFILIFALLFCCQLGSAIAETHTLEVFSVDPPTSTKWEKSSSRNQIKLGRTLGEPLHSIILNAQEWPPLPGPIDSVASLQEIVRNRAIKEQSQMGRYELTKHTESISKHLGIECVEYEKAWKDHGGNATQFSELIMKAYGYICIHPEDPTRLVDVSYSTRNASGIVPEDAQREGKEFINSLKAVGFKR